MKPYYCFFLLIQFSSFSFGQIKEKKSIFILSVQFSTTTFISIPCENFATQFKKRIKINEVFADDSIAMLDQFIKKIKFSKKQVNVDTRAKLIYRNTPDNEFIICTDGYNILINGSLIKRNKIFLNFILSLIPKKQLVLHR